MKSSFLLKITFSVGFFISSMGVLFSFPFVPSTASSLVKNEQRVKKEALMRDIEVVVKKALRRKKRKKKKQSKAGKKSSIPGMKVVKKDLLSDEIIYLLEKQYLHKDLTKKISIRLQDVEVVQAVRLIAHTASLPVVVDANVRGEVNGFDFKDISLGSAFRILKRPS